jgi:hypothetical protein
VGVSGAAAAEAGMKSGAKDPRKAYVCLNVGFLTFVYWCRCDGACSSFKLWRLLRTRTRPKPKITRNYAPEPYTHPNLETPKYTSAIAAQESDGLKTIRGLRKRTFWFILLLALIVVAAAVGGGVGGAFSSK